MCLWSNLISLKNYGKPTKDFGETSPDFLLSSLKKLSKLIIKICSLLVTLKSHALENANQTIKNKVHPLIMIIRQTVLTLIVIFVLYFCHICHQDTRSVQKRHFMCIAYPWSPVSIFNISESSLAEVPTRRSFSHIYRPKTIQPPILKYNIVPFSIFRERRRHEDQF